jgi:hypothetical protein
VAFALLVFHNFGRVSGAPLADSLVAGMDHNIALGYYFGNSLSMIFV